MTENLLRAIQVVASSNNLQMIEPAQVVIDKHKNKKMNTLPKNLTQEDAISLLKNNNPVEWQKFGIFEFRVATEYERVITVTSTGKEAENDAKPGDYILTGISGEVYVISPVTFAKRYEVAGEGKAKAVGKAWGNQYEGKDIVIDVPASWNDPSGTMPLNNGDYLISPNPDFTEAYRVDRLEFESTYKPAA